MNKKNRRPTSNGGVTRLICPSFDCTAKWCIGVTSKCSITADRAFILTLGIVITQTVAADATVVVVPCRSSVVVL